MQILYSQRKRYRLIYFLCLFQGNLQVSVCLLDCAVNVRLENYIKCLALDVKNILCNIAYNLFT